MPLLNESTEFGTLRKRDVLESFKMVVAQRPTFTGIIGFNDTPVTDHKHEWLEYKKSPISWTVDGAVDASAGTTIVLDDNTGVQVGDVLGFKTSAGASQTQIAKVTAVDSGGTDLTVSWKKATTNDLADNDVAFLISRARGEFSSESLDDNVAPSEKFNYTQIFRRDFGLSRTTLRTLYYGLRTRGLSADPQANTLSMIEMQLRNQMLNIMYELNNSAIYGLKELRVAGGANGAMGGILEYLETAASSQYNASGALSAAIINNALDQAGENGAIGSELTLMLCHPNQARKLAAFDNSYLQVMREDKTTGRAIATFTSDLIGSNGGSSLTVAVDRSFPEDKIAIMDPSLVKLAAMDGITVEETTDPKNDGRTFKVLGELTLEMRNAADGHMLIYGLNL